MRKRSVSSLIIVFMGMLMFFTSSMVSAKEQVSYVESKNLSGEVVGSIHFYDDYSVQILYKYRLKDLSIEICYELVCEDVAPYGETYLNNEPYEEMGVWEKSLGEYLMPKDDKATYNITISGNFKPSATSPSGSNISLNETVVVNPIAYDDNDEKKEELMTSLEKVIKVCNTWIIPGLYVILALALIIKGVLLSIDIVKYSDNHEMRREKIKAFVFLAVALLCAAVLNTGVGFLTGLFG